MSSDGKIDIYAEDSISVHTKQDLNFLADRDINMQAGRNLNIKVAGEIQIESGKDCNLLIGANGKILLGQTGLTQGAGHLDINAKGHIWQTSGLTNETKAGGNIIETAPKIHMNGPAASTAPKPKELKTHILPTDNSGSIGNLIMRRMPTHEPYPQHENLDPLKYKPAKTDRDIDGRYEGQSTTIKDPATLWKKLSIVDTFRKGS
jgi:hypothetical protein